MQVVGGQFSSRDKNVSEQRHAAPASPLKGAEIGGEPAWPPEIGLFAESQDRATGQWPSRKRSLAMVGRRGLGSFCQFFKFATEDIIHFQVLSGFRCDIQKVCSPGIPIDFLEKNYLSICGGKKFDNGVQF
jgi:hypothetical protein